MTYELYLRNIHYDLHRPPPKLYDVLPILQPTWVPAGRYIRQLDRAVHQPVPQLALVRRPPLVVVRVLRLFWLVPHCVAARAGDALREGVVSVEVGESVLKEGNEGGEQGGEGGVERGLELRVEVVDVGSEVDRGAGTWIGGNEDRGREKGGVRGDGVSVANFGGRDGSQDT